MAAVVPGQLAYGQTPLQCFENHAVIKFEGNNRKMRKMKDGSLYQANLDNHGCNSCRKAFNVNHRGYYSCSGTCDFDLCPRCVECDKGHIMVVQTGIPKAYARIAANSAVKCDRCSIMLTSQQLNNGFMRCEMCS